VVRADAALTFGEVRRVLAAADDAGFGRVALLAERRND
jgi:biopolymer transport protein ExbD